MKSARYYRFLEFCRQSWVYALLIGGALIFSWPFLWMAFTSVKVDRELFGEKIRLFPQRPIPHLRSPYVDTRHFQDVEGPRREELLPVIERALAAWDYPWPDGLDRDTLQREAARGVFKRLQDTVPVSDWRSPELPAMVPGLIRRELVDDAVRQVQRQLLLGQLRARSYDLQEDQLVAPDRVAESWQVSGAARLEQVGPPAEPHAAVSYDFTTSKRFALSQTFTTSFAVARLHRIQLYLRPDDTWHPVTLTLEKLGKKYRAERARELADYSNWGVLTWQEPGPDDRTNKIKTWTLLREVGTSDVTGTNELRVTMEVARTDALGAWWAKIARNYRFALDHIPFWRYVATSIFLVVLNLVGTLFSCSLVAYAFARLQWPGRNFCFALMLATMMVPGQVTMIPYFLIVKALGWYNTLYPLWVGSFFAGAFNVFLLRQFLKGIPRDLEDAAKIDGCGFWRVYWHIMLPLIKPTLAAIAIFTFMGTWNEFMGPLIYLQDQRQYPLALGLYAFNVQAGGSMSMMMAGSLMMTAPVIIIFFFAQKYFIQGITLTGMKG